MTVQNTLIYDISKNDISDYSNNHYNTIYIMIDNIIEVGNRIICIKGIGKLFFESGFPISISLEMLRKENIETSIFHVADECMKNGWSAKTTYNKLKADFADQINDNNIDWTELKKFCNTDYVTQRQMINEYLFKDVDAVNYLEKIML